MSGNADDPESTIPWPGFVDILSTVIIVFVFFMMLTSVIIFVLSQQDKTKAVEKAKAEAVAEAATESVEDKTNKINQILLENKALKEQIDKLIQVKSVLAESENQTTARDAKSAKITFGDFGVTLQPKTIEFLKSLFPLKGKVTLETTVPTGNNFGSTREIALNRALNVRNILIQEGLKPENIALKILDESTSEDNSYGNVRITFDQ
jgi:hypothetical protein